MAAQLEAIPPHDAKVMLRKYLEKHIGVIDKQRQDAKNLANLEVQLKEKQQALNEVERSCHLKGLEFDRRYANRDRGTHLVSNDPSWPQGSAIVRRLQVIMNLHAKMQWRRNAMEFCWSCLIEPFWLVIPECGP